MAAPALVQHSLALADRSVTQGAPCTRRAAAQAKKAAPSLAGGPLPLCGTPGGGVQKGARQAGGLKAPSTAWLCVRVTCRQRYPSAPCVSVDSLHDASHRR